MITGKIFLKKIKTQTFQILTRKKGSLSLGGQELKGSLFSKTIKPNLDSQQI